MPGPFAPFFGGIDPLLCAMESPAGVAFLERKSAFWFVATLAIVLFAITNLPWHLDEYDQAKQAFTCFEMVKQGHWIYQHTPNGWVATKPPLVGWISAGFFAVTRSWDLAWRLPSFLAGLALLFLIARAAAVYGSAAVLVAACAFSLNLFTPRLATLVRTDMPLALILFVIGWLIWEKIRRRETWKARDRLVFFVLLSAAMLIKGPIVYAFLLPGIVAFQWRTRGTREAVTAWSGWWPWLASLAIFLAWAIGGILFVPEFSEHVVMREFAGRFSEAMHRSQPIYFYLPHFLHRFAPWSILLILVAAARGKRAKPQNSRLAARDVAGNILARRLEPRGFAGDVFRSVQADRSRLPDRAAALFAACRPGRRVSNEGKVENGDRKVLHDRDRNCVPVYDGLRRRENCLGYRQHSDAFATFGYAVRQEAAAHGWNYEIVGGEDEGMALYVRRTEFLEPDQAAAEWNSGKLDGLVVPDDELTDLLPRLPGAVPSKIGWSGPAGRYRKRYIFLVRS